MLTGIKNSKNNIICVIDGDGQNPPSEAKKMRIWMREDDFDFKILCGHRVNRMDNFIKEFLQKIANYVRRLIAMMTVLILLVH